MIDNDFNILNNYILNGDEDGFIDKFTSLKKNEKNNKNYDTEIEHLKDKNGNTLLMLSILYDRNKITKILLAFSKSNINSVNNDGSSVIALACFVGNGSLVKDLISMDNFIKDSIFRKNLKGNTPIDYLLEYIF